MKRILFIALTIVWGTGHGQVLKSGQAEDLWGNPVNINDTVKAKTTVIVPFSTSNCGYCLIDGYFSGANYLANNQKRGGSSFEQCLFNPQLDIYVFGKEFQTDYPVLTFPPALHKIHDDGFPTVLAFKNGVQVLQFHYNYTEFQELNDLLWDQQCLMTPRGNLHMADRFLYENEHQNAIYVFPDGADIEGKKSTWINNSITFKHMSELDESDRHKNLCFVGNHDAATLSRFFNGENKGISFSHDSIVLGEYSFAFDSAGVFAWCTNPFNPGSYVVLNIRHGNKLPEPVNYLDFIVFTGKDSASFKKIMYGQYDFSRGRPEIVPQKTFSDVSMQQFCRRSCHIPLQAVPEMHPVKEVSISQKESLLGSVVTMGNDNCRFPRMSTDEEGNVWIVYEENGDIVLNNVVNKGKPFCIEPDHSDSYNPVLVNDEGRIWVFYLNNRDSYYRVYARYIENEVVSDAIRLSDEEPVNASHLSVARKAGEISVAWSEWKANQRYLKLCRITDGVVGNPEAIALAPSQYTEDYHNGWSPSLAYLSNGELWAAWNQHYPGNFCTIAGKTGEQPQVVTATARKMDDWENGGYPCLATAGNRKMIAYESSGWDVVLYHKPQCIKVREYNDDLRKWSLPVVLPMPEKMILNQTPSLAFDKEGDAWLAWSGRSEDENSCWGIYLAVRHAGKWSKAVLISAPGVNARYPQVAINGKDDSVWVSWHAGRGKEMKVEVIRLKEEIIRKMKEPEKN